MTADPTPLNRETRRAVARVAKRPPAREVEVTIADGPFEGWHASMRADFPAGLLVLTETKRAGDLLEFAQATVIEHNMPNGDGELAARLVDVDPYDGLLTVIGALLDKLGTLPNR